MVTAELARPLTANEQRNLEVVAEVLPFWNRQDIPGVLAFYDDNITWRNVAMEEVYHGKIEVGAFMEQLFTAMPDFHFEVTHKIAHGDNISEQWTISGTHNGPFFGIPATGKRLELPGMSMVEMKRNKFYRDNFYLDGGMMLRQLGLLPSLSATFSPVGKAALYLAVKPRVVAAGLGGVVGGVGLLRWWRRRA